MITEGVSIEEYHASKNVSSSKLGTLDEAGARAYWIRHVRGEARPSTEAQVVGQCFEDAVCGTPTHAFTPEEGEGAEVVEAWLQAHRETHVIKPEKMNFATKAGKEWKAERADLEIISTAAATKLAWAEEHEGKHVLSPKCQGLFEYGVKHVRENATARALIEQSQEQLTLRTEWPGLPGLQSRPDWLSLTGCSESGWAPYAPDLKTTRKPLGQFAWEARRYGYHRQAAIVDICLREDGVEDVRHPLIVVEKTFPYRCQVMWLRPEFVADGDRQAVRLLDELAEHYESGEWPTVTSDEEDLYPPGYRPAADDEEAA